MFCTKLCLSYNLQCSANGRSEEASTDVLSIQEINQIGEDPLLILDGIV